MADQRQVQPEQGMCPHCCEPGIANIPCNCEGARRARQVQPVNPSGERELIDTLRQALGFARSALRSGEYHAADHPMLVDALERAKQFLAAPEQARGSSSLAVEREVQAWLEWTPPEVPDKREVHRHGFDAGVAFAAPSTGAGEAFEDAESGIKWKVLQSTGGMSLDELTEFITQAITAPNSQSQTKRKFRKYARRAAYALRDAGLLHAHATGGPEREALSAAAIERAYVEAGRQGLITFPVSAESERIDAKRVEAVVAAALASQESSQ